MKLKLQKLPKKETKSLYNYQQAGHFGSGTTSSETDTTGTCTTIMTTTHFNK